MRKKPKSPGAPPPPGGSSSQGGSSLKSKALATIAKAGLPAPTGLATAGAGEAVPLKKVTHSSVLFGGVVVALFFFGLGGWAVTAPLDSAAIATGIISPDGSRRTVQHLEGGIIRNILVTDGDKVIEGQPLVVLEDTRARADFDDLLNQLRTLTAIRSRLAAEQQDLPEIEFPDWLLNETYDPEVRTVLDAQIDLLTTRREAHENRIAILGQRLAQQEAEIAGLDAQVDSLSEQGRLIEQEVAGVQELLAKGLERQPRLLALQRAAAQIQGVRAETVSQIARIDQAIGETRLEMINLNTERLDRINEELVGVQAEISSIQERVRASEDVLTRTEIVAPVSGTVVESQFTTLGGIIAPGQPILDIVPINEELLIDARVSPLDVDVVRPGLEASIVLSAFKQRNMPRLNGTVRSVSADAIIDEASGTSYFRTRIEVDKEQLAEVAPDIELQPGMPADVMITTGQQTAFQYLIGPLVDTVRFGMREG